MGVLEIKALRERNSKIVVVGDVGLKTGSDLKEGSQ